ncbi:Rts2p NDAI_0F00430 [Naumovozyma dairenensis CBS 421]|uniref:C2H2-type domain-containing protein n=1 Tax=Naumovozyma dairenensis (strain ATCC 10597 / BCRC 20456 / CBS 421 / NBRC 0211 / NRRL Y-12639) TaxID=1071378 RepID=G0WC51_NAUDC|nr:hypothetical protein NDAI_0F00430 [Naumovozyma dairenensis CBS 421]CCD25362.1 hypothetical protein NDAI_0F00430 [Naumovozyma dairenensis CBS 421]
MGQAEFGTAKYLSKQMKAKGLQKLKFYCQICSKQCRDENGFKSHIKSPSHLLKIANVTNEDIENYSVQFEKDFLKLLKLNHGEKPIQANKFYNEFIQDKNHIHMNSTNFTSLNKFIKYLSKNGKIKIHGLQDYIKEKGNDSDNNLDMGQLMISFIDTSSENVLRKQKISEMALLEKTHHEINNIMLQNQIKKNGISIVTDTSIDYDNVTITDVNQEVHLNEIDPISLTIPSSNKNKSKISKKTKKKKNQTMKLKSVFGP